VSNPPDPLTTVVIGGGIAGLVTAWELARAGRSVTVLEAGPELGGAIARHRVGGLTLDAGAESFATATSAVVDLITDLGLSDDVVVPNPVGAWVRHTRGSAPLPTDSLLGIPAHPLARDVRRVLGPVGAVRASADLLLPRRLGSAAPTLGAVVGTRMGRAVVDRLVEPVAGGVYSTDPDELEMDSVQPKLRATVHEAGSLARAVRALRATSARPGSAVGGLVGGLYCLVEALRGALLELNAGIRTGVDVDHIRSTDDGWHVVVAGAEGLTAQDVVLAVPGMEIGRLLAPLQITVPQTAGATSTVKLVTLVVDEHALDAHPRGTGILVSRHATGVRAKALTHATAKWPWLAQAAGPGHHVLRLSYGRGDEQVPDNLTEVALADASELLGVRLDASTLIDSAEVTWIAALPRPQAGHRAAMDRLRKDVRGHNGLHITGSMLEGTGLAAVVAGARSTARHLLSVTTQARGPKSATA
jgi:oxygen-dependent protoporphyrinogen oxidase